MKPIKKTIFILIFAAIVLLILKLVFTPKKENPTTATIANTAETTLKKEIKKNSPIKTRLPIPTQDQTDETWTAWFEHEATQIGYLTEYPTEIQKQMQETASVLPKDRIPWLQKRAKNEKINTDQRLLAIEYLSLNQNVETLDALENIALSPIDKDLSPELKNEAIILKAAAIEGFLAKDNFKTEAIIKLNHIVSKTDEKFLSDRAHRSLWYLRGLAEKPEEQDRKALKQLLEGSTK